MAYILVKKEEQVTTLTFNRPEALNAINTEMLLELENVLDTIATDPNTRVVIVTGAGEKAFIAGADIKEMLPLSPEEAFKFSSYGQHVLQKLTDLPQPVIAAINGYALGGGCELALACDLRIASANAVFSQPEVSLGVIPGFGGTQRLTQLLGIAKAKELILTGKKITADEAYSLGLVHKVVAYGLAQSAAYEWAVSLANLAPFALTQAKKAINYNAQLLLEQGLQAEASYFSACFATADQNEGMESFLAKRKPVFTGK